MFWLMRCFGVEHGGSGRITGNLSKPVCTFLVLCYVFLSRMIELGRRVTSVTLTRFLHDKGETLRACGKRGRLSGGGGVFTNAEAGMWHSSSSTEAQPLRGFPDHPLVSSYFCILTPSKCSDAPVVDSCQPVPLSPSCTSFPCIGSCSSFCRPKSNLLRGSEGTVWKAGLEPDWVGKELSSAPY